jgi:glutathione S-transferase kappa 1
LIANPAAGGEVQNAAPRIVVELFFDILSPYSYFAFETLCRYREVWKLQLKLRPVFQSAIIKATNNAPPALQPVKAPYLTKDIRRLSTYFELPLGRFPPSRMQSVLMGTLPVQRMLVAVQAAHGDEVLEIVTRNLWQRYLLRDEDILEESSKVAVLQEGTGLSAEQARAVLEAANQDAAKKALSDNTAEALKHGAFGVPTIVFPVVQQAEPGSAAAAGGSASVSKQMVFGSDRFHIMAQLLGKRWMGPRPDKEQAAPVPRRMITSRL